MAEPITLSVIKADVGGYVGHSHMHPALVETATEHLTQARERGLLMDFSVLSCGDDLELVMTHTRGELNEDIHRLAWDTLVACTGVAKKLKLYGAGQDLLKDAFSGNVRGLGPGVAEMSFVERKSEPVLVFMADKASPSAWSLPLYKMFADPFNTAGLVIDPAMTEGFSFDVLDIVGSKLVRVHCPEEIYILLALIGGVERYLVKRVWRRADNEIAASASTQKLALIAGKYVGKDDPVLIVRAQAGFPAVGEIMEAFAFPHLVEGWNRGSHFGPLVPVPFRDATPTRFDGPPRVTCAGFQIADGKLEGPVDMFDDPSFDGARALANQIASYMRSHGAFEPHRLPLESMEYTTIPQVIAKLSDRFVSED
jgi:fructose 1,6-bisphosphate aldolase/phosphatase